MPGVVAHPRLALDDLGHPLKSPEVGGVAVGTSSLQQHLLNGLHLRDGQTWQPPGSARAFQGRRPAGQPLLHPVAGRLTGDVQGLRYRGRSLSGFEHPGCPHATTTHARKIPTRPHFRGGGTRLGRSVGAVR